MTGDGPSETEGNGALVFAVAAWALLLAVAVGYALYTIIQP